jgi:PPOX class probable F420-dependent enzyme
VWRVDELPAVTPPVHHPHPPLASDRGGSASAWPRYREPVIHLPEELRDLISSGPLTHLSTINADGSPQVTVVWIGLDGDDLLTGHMHPHLKVRNMQRDRRVVLSFAGPRRPQDVLNEYAVLRARATVEPSDQAWDLLDRLTKVYMSPDTTFPAPRGPGFIVRYRVERIGGVGPWVSAQR